MTIFFKRCCQRKNWKIMHLKRNKPLKALFMCMLLPYAPRITVVSGTLCQALLVTLPVKIPHVPHVKSIIGGRMVLVGVVMVSIGQCSEMQSNIRICQGLACSSLRRKLEENLKVPDRWSRLYTSIIDTRP